MAPKQAMSKKNKEKKKNQAISDATFGLKNKNKSAKVQSYVKQVEVTMKNNLSDAVGLFLHFTPQHFTVTPQSHHLIRYFLCTHKKVDFSLRMIITSINELFSLFPIP